MSSNSSTVSEAESHALGALLTLHRQTTHSSAKRSSTNLNHAPHVCEEAREEGSSNHASSEAKATALESGCTNEPSAKRSLMEAPDSTQHSGSSLGSEDAAKMLSNGGSNEDSNTSASPTSSDSTTTGSSDSSTSHRGSGSSSSASDSFDSAVGTPDAKVHSARHSQQQRLESQQNSKVLARLLLPRPHVHQLPMQWCSVCSCASSNSYLLQLDTRVFANPPKSVKSRSSSSDLAHPCPTCQKVRKGGLGSSSSA